MILRTFSGSALAINIKYERFSEELKANASVVLAWRSGIPQKETVRGLAGDLPHSRIKSIG
jgi:hypothetical protein